MTGVKVFCDGGSRGNPGPAAAAAVIFDGSGAIIDSVAEYMGETTNNQAEYHAVELGLAALLAHKISEAEFYLDSELVVRQLNGIYKVKHPDMKIRFESIQKLIKGLHVSFSHVVRSQNTIADAAVNECLDSHLDKRS